MSLRPDMNNQNPNNPNFRNPNIPTATYTNHVYENEVKNKQLTSKITSDPQGIIPNSIYKVFSHEMRNKTTMILIAFLVALSAGIVIALLALRPYLFSSEIKKAPWGWYVIPVIFLLISSVYFVSQSLELSGIKKSVSMYRDNLRMGSSVTPPFITLLYRKLVLRQVYYTWLVIGFLFYVGIFTLVLWALKDRTFGKLDFKKWIHETFKDPNLIIYILCGIMAGVLVIFIINAIFRKKRIIDIQSFFGDAIMNYSEVAEKRSEANRRCVKYFFLSILLILVIPIIVYIILRKTVLRGGK
ncbi:MSC_0882 family membrane protein [Mycoplasma struthionis]|uniref:Uncharacterized protein n=1 Tax=Mycoplasma struthionis TaxID=538220 RepID=A0A3G8LG90_9MOLU|nr:hypothetical protein [Mycoplasma struthionis]AZG68474.1 hypothetical protein EGN60_00580 [Mycoplasma struthionis]TPI02637.1 hypothetical protein FJM01_00385 [Mycoplasma struthionis]